VIATGTFKEEIVDEDGKKRSFEYEIEKKIRADNIGIVVGRFLTETLLKKSKKFSN
jgi:hypothetical protein